MKQDIINILEHKSVKPTSNRILVLDALIQQHNPVSLADLEAFIQTMDRSSIFRALSVFLEADIVHGIEDGSGSLKYEICHGGDHCSVADMHVHFFCEHCQQTSCFEDIPVPEVPVPDGYTVKSINYMIKGICPACNKHTPHQ